MRWRRGIGRPRNVSFRLRRSLLRSHKDVQREQRAHQDVGHVDRLAYAQVYRDAAQSVRLLAGEAPRLEVLYHVEQRVPGGQADVLALVGAVLAHADTGGGEEAARDGHLRPGEVVVPEELQVPDTPSCGLALPDPEAQVDARPDLYGRPAGLAVALGVVDVARRDQAALGVDRHQHGRAGRDLLDVYVPGRLARRDGPERLPGDRLVGRHGARRLRGQDEPSTLGQLRLALGGAPAQLGARGQAQSSGVRVAADADARKLLGLRVLVAVQPPVDDERIRELVA